MICTDIRISVSFKDHRKRKRLRAMIGPGSTDYILDLWIATAMNHPSGVLDGMDELDIALEAGWNDDPQVFVDALLKCGFLEKNDDGDYQLHDWMEHQEWVINAPKRKEKARNAARKRWDSSEECSEKQSKSSSNATSNQDACYEHATSIPEAMPQPTNQPIESSIEDSCPEPQKAEAPRSSQKEAFVFEIPLVTKTASGESELFGITQAQVDKLADLFPALDVPQELREIEAWNLANPKNRKYRAGFMRHVTQWLTKSQNRARPAMRASPAIQQQNQPRPQEFDPKTIFGEGFSIDYESAATEH